MRFSVVIPTLRRPDSLRDTLRSLMACDPPPCAVLVVDGDPDASAEPVVRGLAGVHYLRTETGLTRQRNVGLDAIGTDEGIVVFVDDDVTVDPALFAVLADAYADPAVAGATVRMEEPPAGRIGGMRSRVRAWLPGGGAEGMFTRYGYPRYLQDPDTPRDVEYMRGGLMSARLRIARRVRFDERLPGYPVAEDEDFSWRLSREGRIRYLPGATVRTRLGFGTRDLRALNRRLVVNRVYLLRKNFAPTPLVWFQFALFIVLLFVHRLLNREWQALRGLAEGVLSSHHPAETEEPLLKGPAR